LQMLQDKIVTPMAIKNRTILLGTICAFSVLISFSLFRELWEFSLNNEYSTHIFLMPVMGAFLILRKRSQIDVSEGMTFWGILPMVLGLVFAGPWSGSLNLSLRALGIVLLWTGAFISIFGIENYRRFPLPLSFLFLMIPIPQIAIHPIVTSLQKGSAEAAAIIFRLTATPFYCDGFTFILPGINIEIATQCSGIRSSLAVLISALLAGHLLLRTWWGKLALVLVSIPLMMVKNGIRIAVLSLLAIHVDKRWLTESALHRDGGVLFYILALVLLFPMLWILRKVEKTPRITRQGRRLQ
jgi:exosortase